MNGVWAVGVGRNSAGHHVGCGPVGLLAQFPEPLKGGGRAPRRIDSHSDLHTEGAR